jgi:lysophospholipase L1-like esterase
MKGMAIRSAAKTMAFRQGNLVRRDGSVIKLTLLKAVALTALVAASAGCGPAAGPGVKAPTATPATSTRPVAALPANCQAELRYVALGDSTVYGVGATAPDRNYVSRIAGRLRADYPRTRLFNLGVSGATSAAVVREQLKHAIASRPDLVTLSVGPNDITGGGDAVQYESNIGAIMDALQRETRAVVVINLLPDMAVAPRFNADEKAAAGRKTILFNQALQRQASRHAIALVDLYTPSQREIPAHPEWIASDDYHPSDEGYARWAELMWPAVAAAIPPSCNR